MSNACFRLSCLSAYPWRRRFRIPVAWLSFWLPFRKRMRTYNINLDEEQDGNFRLRVVILPPAAALRLIRGCRLLAWQWMAE